jgi:flagellar motor switch/type III secretory pathway protein FliN
MGSGQECTLVFNGMTAAAILDRATGGTMSGLRKISDSLTDCEQLILGSVFQDILTMYQNQWLGACQLDLPQVQFQAPKYKLSERIKKETEVVGFQVTIGLTEDTTVTFEFLFSGMVLELLYEKYSNYRKRLPRKVTLYLSPEAIANVPVPVNVRVGTATVMMHDLTSLEPGDVIQLNEKLTDSIFLTVAEETEFYGILGRKQHKYAIKIIEKKARYYDIKTSEDTDTAQMPYQKAESAGTADEVMRPVAQYQPAVQPQVAVAERDVVAEPVVTQTDLSQPVARQTFTPVKDEEIKLQDPLLDELTHDDSAKEEDEEFTWDLDDLK